MNKNYDQIYRELPISITIILYNYNYLDRRIISEIKKNSTLIEKTKTKLVIPADDLKNIITNNFKHEINESSNYPLDKVSLNINTAYQLYHLFLYYNNLKIINITISYEKDYSKLIVINNEEKISFHFKIEKAIVRLDKHFEDNELVLLNSLFRKVKLIQTLNPQSTYSVYASEFKEVLSKIKDTKYKEIINFFDNIISEKLYNDNTILILITDYHL